MGWYVDDRFRACWVGGWVGTWMTAFVPVRGDRPFCFVFFSVRYKGSSWMPAYSVSIT